MKNWDYSSPGYYFFTVCSKNRINIFGEIINNQLSINAAGKIVWDCWYDLPNHYPNLVLDEFIVMPNHIHGIICIIDNDHPNNIGVGDKFVETGLRPVSTIDGPVSTIDGPVSTDRPVSTTNTNKKNTTHGLSEFIRALKSFSARRINKLDPGCANSIWQTRFHDHIIRNHDELCRIREYIKNNPVNWHKDDLNETG
ncbi:MAG TPA: hypothetical protein PLP19_18315 [bacterium]|nr:hypothetical protein [bacterium]